MNLLQLIRQRYASFVLTLFDVLNFVLMSWIAEARTLPVTPRNRNFLPSRRRKSRYLVSRYLLTRRALEPSLHFENVHFIIAEAAEWIVVATRICCQCRINGYHYKVVINLMQQNACQTTAKCPCKHNTWDTEWQHGKSIKSTVCLSSSKSGHLVFSIFKLCSFSPDATETKILGCMDWIWIAI